MLYCSKGIMRADRLGGEEERSACVDNGHDLHQLTIFQCLLELNSMYVKYYFMY